MSSSLVTQNIVDITFRNEKLAAHLIKDGVHVVMQDQLFATGEDNVLSDLYSQWT